MGIKLSKAFRDAVKQPDAVKMLATLSHDGLLHLAVKSTLDVTESGLLFYDELLEVSQTQKNMVNSIWFCKSVAVNVLTKDKKSFLVLGHPVKAVISGQIFQKAYVDMQERFGKETDLSTVWLIEPESEREETYPVRKKADETAHPFECHIDQIVKTFP